MTKKSMVQVVIGGKVLTMGGYDDETHIQRIASCVNRVMRQMEDADEYRCLPADLKPIFIHINIADELVTAQELIEQLEVGIVIVLNIDSELHRYDITGVDFTEIPNDCRLFAAGIICVSPARIDVVTDRSILIVVYTEIIRANRILNAGINGFHRIENHTFGCRKTDAADSKRDFPRPTAAHGC